MRPLSYLHGVLANTTFAFLSRALAVAAGIIMAKKLTPDDLGNFVPDQALVLIGGGLLNLGVGQGYRLLAARKPELQISHLLPAIAVRFCATALYFVGLSLYLNYSGLWKLQTVLVVVGTLLLSFLELFQIDLQISRRFLSASMLDMGRGLVVFLAALSCWVAPDSKYSYLVTCYFALSCLLVIIGWIVVRPSFVPLLRFDYLSLLKTSIPFAAALFVYSINSYYGLIYVRGALGEGQAGCYSVPLKVYQISLVVGMSVTGVTLPLYHKLAASRNFVTFGAIFARLIRGMWLIGGLLVAVCFCVPEFLIRAFATEEYMAAAAVFPLIGFGILFRLLAIPAGNILESVDKQWYRVILQAVGTVICLLAVSVVVPRWGIKGAAWTLFAVDLWTLLSYWFVSKYFAPLVVSLNKLFVPAGVMAGTIIVLSCFKSLPAWSKFLILSSLWSAYVIFILNFKQEITKATGALFRRS